MDDKKTRIIHAAIEVFAEKGLERGKIDDIAKVADIGKGTVYEYFDSKEVLFDAIEEMLIEQMLESLSGHVMDDLRPTEKLQHLIEVSIDELQHMGHAILIITEIWAQAARGHWHDEDKVTTSHLADMYDEYRQYIKEVLREGIQAGEFRKMNPDGVATLLLAFIDGLAWQFMMIKDWTQFEEIKAETIQSFMKGIQQ